MKNLTSVLIGILLSHATVAQETLFKSEIESGWYGGPTIKTGHIIGEPGFLAGGQGGWIMNHRLVLGGKGYILVNPVDIHGLQNITIGFGYGGAFLEYIIASDKLFHISLESLMGVGIVYNDVGNYRVEYDPIDYTGDGCFIFEPGINIILNLTKGIRLGAGITYRMVNGIKYDAGAPYQDDRIDGYQTISNADLGGFSAQLILKIGAF